MSDHNTDHEEHHTGPIKTPGQLLATTIYSFVVPVFIIIGLVYYVVSANKPAAGQNDMEKAIAGRIAKVGSVEVRDANRTMKTGEEVFTAQCSACHATGAAGSPKFKDASAWGPRISKGYETLLTSALKGKGAMGAQGGGDFDDLEVGRAVVYMANAGGAKFPEPQKPAGEAAK